MKKALAVKIVAAGILGVLAENALIPEIMPHHHIPFTQADACLYNLRCINDVKQKWAIEHHKIGSDVPGEADLVAYFPVPTNLNGTLQPPDLPTCPVDPSNTFATSYNVQSVDKPPTCKLEPTKHVFIERSWGYGVTHWHEWPYWRDRAVFWLIASVVLLAIFSVPAELVKIRRRAP